MKARPEARIVGHFPPISAEIGPKKRVFGPISHRASYACRVGRPHNSGKPMESRPALPKSESVLDEEFVTVLLDDLLDGVDVWFLVGRRWQSAACGGLAGRADHVLHAPRDQNEEHPAAGIADRVAVGDVAGAEEVVARACLDRGVADFEGGAALEDPEALVVAVMHVQGRLPPRGLVMSMIVSWPPVS